MFGFSSKWKDFRIFFIGWKKGYSLGDWAVRILCKYLTERQHDNLSSEFRKEIARVIGSSWELIVIKMGTKIQRHQKHDSSWKK